MLAEQGLGDTIQFVRFLPALAERTEVTLVCPTSLHRLFHDLPVALRAPGTPLPADPWVNLMSLPRLLGTNAGNIPHSAGYLAAAPPPGRRSRRIGVVWRGNPAHSNDRRRSLPTEALRPLTGVAGVELVSLQVGPLAHEAMGVLGVTTLGARNRDWSDTGDLGRELRPGGGRRHVDRPLGGCDGGAGVADAAAHAGLALGNRASRHPLVRLGPAVSPSDAG